MLFSGKNINLLSADFAQKVVKIMFMQMYVFEYKKRGRIQLYKKSLT